MAEVRTPLTSGQRTPARGLFLTLTLITVLMWAFFVTGCQVAQWRVFQKKVPTNVEKPAAQVEGEKRAAAYIAQRSAAPVADPAKAVEDIHAVAAPLRASLGEPAAPVVLTDEKAKDATIAALRVGLAAKDSQLEQWKAFGRKYGDTPLDNTGINLAGPAGLVGLVAVVAACIAFPALGYALLRVLPLLWGFFRRTTAAVNELATTNAGAADALKATLSRRMDDAHKKLVARWASPAKT